jgi:hypothetical protein
MSVNRASQFLGKLLRAATGNITERLQRLGRMNSNMTGTALFTEGMDTNPFAFDLFTEMAWRREPVDVASWTADFVRRKYGADDPHALADSERVGVGRALKGFCKVCNGTPQQLSWAILVAVSNRIPL